MLFIQISTDQLLKCINLKDELNCSYNGGGVAYLLQSIAILFNLTFRSIIKYLLLKLLCTLARLCEGTPLQPLILDFF